MKVYVLQITLNGKTCGMGITEVQGVFSSLEAAKRRVMQREGLVFLDWREHNAHGPSWTAKVQFRVNNGPPLVNQYAITEHEVLL